jgi:hypothetical protein
MIIVAFAAAIVLVAAQRSPAIALPTKRAGIDVSLDYCIDILDHHKAQIRTASQAIQVLQRLRTQENTSTTHGKIKPVGVKMVLVQLLTRESGYSSGSYEYTTATKRPNCDERNNCTRSKSSLPYRSTAAMVG